MSDQDEPSPRAEIDLEAFLRILPHLDSGELMAISAAYHDADAEARVAARALASGVARRRHLIDELGRVQGSIIQWAGSDISRSGAFTFADVRPDQMLGDIRVQAVPPLLDAATALLLGDALDQTSRDALLEPWTSADA
jgi:hypothetical protein